MTADTITIERLEALELLLANSCQTIRRARLMSISYEMRPEHAVEIVHDVAESIAKFCES